MISEKVLIFRLVTRTVSPLKFSAPLAPWGEKNHAESLRGDWIGLSQNHRHGVLLHNLLPLSPYGAGGS